VTTFGYEIIKLEEIEEIFDKLVISLPFILIPVEPAELPTDKIVDNGTIGPIEPVGPVGPVEPDIV
jgi:hypothetical protein